jgi:hypothetical protein
VTGTDNELMDDGTYTYTYDAEGNRIAKFIDTNGDGVLDAGDTNITQYTWDARDRLTEVRNYATYADVVANTPPQVADYLYDGENRWIGENIFTSGGEQETRFAYDGDQIVLEFDKDVVDNNAIVGATDLSHRYRSVDCSVPSLQFSRTPKPVARTWDDRSAQWQSGQAALSSILGGLGIERLSSILAIAGVAGVSRVAWDHRSPPGASVGRQDRDDLIPACTDAPVDYRISPI